MRCIRVRRRGGIGLVLRGRGHVGRSHSKILGGGMVGIRSGDMIGKIIHPHSTLGSCTDESLGNK